MYTEEDAAKLDDSSPTGTILVIEDGDDVVAVIRDDEDALRWDANPGEHWFEGKDPGDPMGLYELIHSARVVYRLGEPVPHSSRGGQKRPDIT